MSDDALLGYRPCVGLIVTKGDGRVFAGRRNDLSPNDPAAWQLPQGGIDEGEETVAAGLRELEEETGIPASLARPFATSRALSAHNFHLDAGIPHLSRPYPRW